MGMYVIQVANKYEDQWKLFQVTKHTWQQFGYVITADDEHIANLPSL